MGSGEPLLPFPPHRKSPRFPCECKLAVSPSLDRIGGIGAFVRLKVILKRLSIPRGMSRLSAPSPGPEVLPTPAKRQQGIQVAEAREDDADHQTRPSLRV